MRTLSICSPSWRSHELSSELEAACLERLDAARLGTEAIAGNSASARCTPQNEQPIYLLALDNDAFADDGSPMKNGGFQFY